MLEARALTASYAGAKALDALTLSVAPGELFCLLGPNGAGKTTTIRLFLGFLHPQSGEAVVGGVVAHRDPAGARRQIAYIPEQVMLYPELTGAENLSFFASLARSADLTRPETEAALQGVGLDPAALDSRVATYSKGMRQKVGIAIARARGARVLLLDEPTSGLDPQASNEFSVLLESLKSERVAVLMATHDLFRAQAVATHVGILNRGKLVATFSPGELSPGELERRYLQEIGR
jgi:ABC-2 type transport system ATP-binding protein